jgi:hypothetical protein
MYSKATAQGDKTPLLLYNLSRCTGSLCKPITNSQKAQIGLISATAKLQNTCMLQALASPVGQAVATAAAHYTHTVQQNWKRRQRSYMLLNLQCCDCQRELLSKTNR